MALVTPRDVSNALARRQAARAGDPNRAASDATQTDDEREPFHLDDTEIAARIGRDRGLPLYRTPPHAHLVFPTLVEQ